MSDKYQVHIGGSLEKAQKGDFELDLKSILAEGWKNTQHSKWVMLQGILLAFAISYAMILLFVPAEQLMDFAQFQTQANPFLAMAITFLITPLIAAVQVMGIRHSIGAKSRFNDLFRFVPAVLLLGTTELATGLLINIGLTAYILPGIYLLITTTFAIPLVAERKLTPFKAIWTSIRAVNHKWWQFALLLLFFTLLALVCIFTMGLALIWVGPFYYNVKGILYRNIFGTMIQFQDGTTNSQQKETEESVLDA